MAALDAFGSDPAPDAAGQQRDEDEAELVGIRKPDTGSSSSCDDFCATVRCSSEYTDLTAHSRGPRAQ